MKRHLSRYVQIEELINLMVRNGARLAFNRAKVRLAILWLRDESLAESDNLLDPDFIAKKSSTTSKPHSNNSAKSPLT